jgi:predicted RNase H-like HicB family nuclease
VTVQAAVQPDAAELGVRRLLLARLCSLTGRRLYARFPRGTLNLSIEMEREEDGRWIAEVADLPGVLAYGARHEEALARVEALALRVLAERLEHGEQAPESFAVTFLAA